MTNETTYQQFESEVEDVDRTGEASENAIDFIRNSKTATVFFTQGRYISRIKKLKASHPDEVEITHENKDGSIVAHVPTAWIKINPPKQLSEEQIERVKENFAKAREKKQGK